MTSSLFTETTVDLSRAASTTIDRYGNPDGVTETVYAAACPGEVQPTRTVGGPAPGDGDATVSPWRVYVEGDPGIKPGDIVTFQGRRYEVREPVHVYRIGNGCHTEAAAIYADGVPL